jgi:hypothetical protein
VRTAAYEPGSSLDALPAIRYHRLMPRPLLSASDRAKVGPKERSQWAKIDLTLAPPNVIRHQQ